MLGFKKENKKNDKNIRISVNDFFLFGFSQVSLHFYIISLYCTCLCLAHHSFDFGFINYKSNSIRQRNFLFFSFLNITYHSSLKYY